MIRRPPRSTRVRSSAASDVYKRQLAPSRQATPTVRRSPPRVRSLSVRPTAPRRGRRAGLTRSPSSSARGRRGGNVPGAPGAPGTLPPRRPRALELGDRVSPARRPLRGAVGRTLRLRTRGGLRRTVGVACRDGASCLLYTSDAADDLTRVDLGGRRI